MKIHDFVLCKLMTWREQRNEVGLRRAAGAAASNGVQLDEVSGTLRSVQNSELKSRDIVIEFCRITAECGWPPARAGITSGMREGHVNHEVLMSDILRETRDT